VASVDEHGSVTITGSGEGAVTAWFSSQIVIAGITVPWPNSIPAEVCGAPERTQDCAVSLQKCVCPAVSAKSKLRDRRFLRLPVTCSQRNPRSTPPITAATSANAQALRLSGCVNSATSKIAPLIISRHPFPPQLSPLSDSYVAPGDYLNAG